MKITVEIDDNELEQRVIELIAREAASRAFQYSERKGIEKAVKAVLDGRKDEIVEKAVNRAAESLVRKGLPKLIEKMQEATE